MRSSWRVGVVGGLWLVAGGCSTRGAALRVPSGEGVEATTLRGNVRGTRVGSARVFLGIPYAAPPVGPLRWMPPAPVDPWPGVLDARAPGPECPQIERGALLRGEVAPSNVVGREDCLRLNVWTHADGRRRPVMVFVHGGAFIQGSGTEATYDATRFSTGNDVVVVTLNYRLGALGFFEHPALARATPDGAVGNQGIQDQIAALRWVHDNIASFGGDPTNVTVFGESAGATSVCALIASPQTEGLLQRAIAESGGNCAGWPTPDAGGGRSRGGYARTEALISAAGCASAPDPLACMRALDPGHLVTALVRARPAGSLFPETGPVIDGHVLTATASERYASGAIRTPLLLGSNADEGLMFAGPARVPDRASYEARIRESSGPQADAILGIYPASLMGDPHSSYVRAFGELTFVCPTESLATTASASGAPVFLYHFTHHASGVLGRAVGAFHGIELTYLFETAPEHYEPTAEDHQVSTLLQQSWSRFAHLGVPADGAIWPRFHPNADTILRIDAPPRLVRDVTEGRCARLRATTAEPDHAPSAH